MTSLRIGSLAARDERPAVIEAGRGRISYAELDRLADAVAARWRALGVAPGARIGLYARRSADAIAAMLGTLRAGCTYVPVDPRAPVERNAAIHRDCGVAATLVEERFAADYADAARRAGAALLVERIPEVGLGRAIREWASAGAGGERRTERPEIACVLYTSGSTGRPKGWMMTSAAIEAHAAWCHRLLAPNAADVFANHAEFSFGMSLFDVYSSLTAGASVMLVPDEARPFAAHVVEALARERATISFSAPAILAGIGASGDVESRDLSRLRAVAFAGEVFPAPALAALRRRLPHPRYFNFYGSTETNVAAYHELPAGATLGGPPPIGRPCEHYEARIAGVDGAIAPRGSFGELQLRGVGLSSGYVNQPALGEEKLVAAADGGSPWYRTGDLVVALASGDLRYAGRIGRMVKVRGYRVEPGEIEARLHEHPGVREVGVVPAEGRDGLELVAHLGGRRIPIVELKEFCAVKLPPYMIPARFVFHDALPRTSRGKIDFERLCELS